MGKCRVVKPIGGSKKNFVRVARGVVVSNPTTTSISYTATKDTMIICSICSANSSGTTLTGYGYIYVNNERIDGISNVANGSNRGNGIVNTIITNCKKGDIVTAYEASASNGFGYAEIWAEE